jgi:hypothetical protein
LSPSPLVKELKEGRAIKLENGTVIKPEQCILPAKEGGRFLLVDCPSLRYMDSIRSQLSPANIHSKEKPLALVIHLMGERSVFESEAYQSWIAEFDPEVQVKLSYSLCFDAFSFRYVSAFCTLQRIKSIISFISCLGQNISSTGKAGS